jgi:hypothetical protein
MEFIGQKTGKPYKIEATRWIGENNELLDISFDFSFDPKKIIHPIERTRIHEYFRN